LPCPGSVVAGPGLLSLRSLAVTPVNYFFNPLVIFLSILK
jgi:hypothetical protein